jgi:hypothetical protein
MNLEGRTAARPQQQDCPSFIPTVAFAPGGRTLTVVVDRAEMSANSGRDTIFD